MLARALQMDVDAYVGKYADFRDDLLPPVRAGVQFTDGQQVEREDTERKAAA